MPGSDEYPILWAASMVERYCVDSGRAVRMPGDRCLSHGARGVMCMTAERTPPKCQHPRLSRNHPYPHCSECGLDGQVMGPLTVGVDADAVGVRS